MKPRNFNEIRKALMKKKALLLKSVRDKEKDIKEEIANRHGDDVDIAEADYEQEMSFYFKSRGEGELRKITDALARMDKGEYGVCVECGEDIPKKRLTVLPYSSLCVECQEKMEEEGVASRR
ncbi:MAG: TraR/DksA family transcriptional regulator [Candidatus Nitrospinota bacterium M3_3B_026]